MFLVYVGNVLIADSWLMDMRFMDDSVRKREYNQLRQGSSADTQRNILFPINRIAHGSTLGIAG